MTRMPVGPTRSCGILAASASFLGRSFSPAQDLMIEMGAHDGLRVIRRGILGERYAPKYAAQTPTQLDSKADHRSSES